MLCVKVGMWVKYTVHVGGCKEASDNVWSVVDWYDVPILISVQTPAQSTYKKFCLSTVIGMNLQRPEGKMEKNT